MWTAVKMWMICGGGRFDAIAVRDRRRRCRLLGRVGRGDGAGRADTSEGSAESFEFATGFGVGSERRTGESMNIQPVLPFSLTSAWTLIARPSLSVAYEPPPDDGPGRPRRGQGVEPWRAVDQRAARRLQARRASRGPDYPDPIYVLPSIGAREIAPADNVS